MDLDRRRFLQTVAIAATARPPDLDGLPELAPGLRARLDACRPSRLEKLPAGFRDRVGASHVKGLYHLTDRPFLVEGAERLIALGTRLGKFWFSPGIIAESYPWNSRWPACGDYVELARSDDFRAAFDLPFRTIILEALMPHDEAWRSVDPAAPERLEESERAIHDLTAHLYRTYRDRDLTFILQNWEGDWRLRGGYSEDFRPPPAELETLASRMARWLAARQRGVERARAAFAAGARCRVAHAAEVNRVLDAFRGVPTVVRDVLPRVTVDLASYSSYDALGSPEELARAILEIRRCARTGPMFGPGAVMLGEIGVPENDRPDRVAEHWDGWLGATIALDVTHVVQWELYCNEPKPGAAAGGGPLKAVDGCRGFFLVRPDGELSATGRVFADLWRRAGA
ncbi:hypothetical protein [Paludisphaera mucosa]|uniref:GH10 domain-containing protein n=1 Tax=Paludisphaera mucosa TaxID=3030827 RepID=A0ABT6FJR1_9BACT|nr:hypothetical protein [Paludisphaera mucosa]MDG3007779.1 hypothetical protein [Paludisphaera mucosa]